MYRHLLILSQKQALVLLSEIKARYYNQERGGQGQQEGEDRRSSENNVLKLKLGCLLSLICLVAEAVPAID